VEDLKWQTKFKHFEGTKLCKTLVEARSSRTNTLHAYSWCSCRLRREWFGQADTVKTWVRWRTESFR